MHKFVLSLLLTLLVAQVHAALPNGLPKCFKSREIARGLGFPTDFCSLPDGQVLILDKSGRVRNGAGSTVLDISGSVSNSGELGLLACAVSPNFEKEPYIYLSYSNNRIASPAAYVVSRFTYQNGRLDKGSERIIFGSCKTSSDCLRIKPGHPFHTGGAIHFGPDGYLYFAKGDAQTFEGPSADVSPISPQELGEYHGKIMRIDRQTGRGVSTNPFWNGNADSVQSRIFATGFRNPWTFTFIPGSKNLAVYDVGWYTRETVKEMSPGANGGWPCYEGRNKSPQRVDYCSRFGKYREFDPKSILYSYAGPGAAIIGGSFFSKSNYGPEWSNRMLIADFVQGRLMSVRRNGAYNGDGERFGNANGVTNIKQSSNGNLWLLQMDNGGSLREIYWTCGGLSSLASKPTTTNKPGVAEATATDMVPKPTILPQCLRKNSKIPALPDGWSRVMDATELGMTCVKQRSFPANGCSINVNGQGLPFSVANRRYAKGWGVMLPAGPSRVAPNISLPVNGQCSKFTTSFGLEGLASSVQAKLGRAEFLIWLDGRLGWNSTQALRRVVAWNTPGSASVNLIGVKNIVLQVRSPSGPNAAQSLNTSLNADWVNPVLYCGPDSEYTPTAKINNTWMINNQPARSLIVRNGDNVTVSGLLAKDWLGKPIPSSNWKWYVNLAHCVGKMCHRHGQMFSAEGSNAVSWQVLPHETDCVYWQVELVVTDSCGRTNFATREVRVAGSQDRACFGVVSP